MADSLLRILRNELLQLGLCKFMFSMGFSRAEIRSRQLSPRIGGDHVNNLDCLKSWPRGLDVKQGGWLSGLQEIRQGPFYSSIGWPSIDPDAPAKVFS